MLTYVASRVTSGNTLFPDKITIDAVNVTYYKGHLTGYQSIIISRKNIASVFIGKGLLFGDVNIETIGGKLITASGFSNSDAKSIVAFLSLNNYMEGDNNQNIYINNSNDQTFTKENIQLSTSKISPEKMILLLAYKSSILSLSDVILKTGLEMEEAENILEKFVVKGIAEKIFDSSAKLIYKFPLDIHISNESIVIVKRIKKFSGSLAKVNILINGQQVSSVANGQETSFVIPNGKHKIKVENSLRKSFRSDEVLFEAYSQKIIFTIEFGFSTRIKIIKNNAVKLEI